MVARSAGSAQAVGRFGNHEMPRRAAGTRAGCLWARPRSASSTRPGSGGAAGVRHATSRGRGYARVAGAVDRTLDDPTRVTAA